MMKKKNVIATVSSVLIIGLLLGYFVGKYHCIHNFVKFAGVSFNMFFTKSLAERSTRAYNAYKNEPLEVGIWALEGLEQEFQRTLDMEIESTGLMKKGIHYDLMLTHARLIKLYSKKGDTEKIKSNEEKALYYGKLAYPNAEKFSNIKRILELVDRIDRNVNKKKKSKNRI